MIICRFYPPNCQQFNELILSDVLFKLNPTLVCSSMKHDWICENLISVSVSDLFSRQKNIKLGPGYISYYMVIHIFLKGSENSKIRGDRCLLVHRKNSCSQVLVLPSGKTCSIRPVLSRMKNGFAQMGAICCLKNFWLHYCFAVY